MRQPDLKEYAEHAAAQARLPMAPGWTAELVAIMAGERVDPVKASHLARTMNMFERNENVFAISRWVEIHPGEIRAYGKHVDGKVYGHGIRL